MNARELILLSPFRMPAQSDMMLGKEDVASFLNAFIALWHPAALIGANGPPKIDSPYDYEQPKAGHIYAVPDTPPLVLPDDWEQRVTEAGAVVFKATPDRQVTLANLLQALRSQPDFSGNPLLDLPLDRAAPFLGVGFGYLMVDTLFEAMQHEKLLSVEEFWHEVQDGVAALGDVEPEAFRNRLKSAAERLLAAREVLYPVTIHLIDFFQVDETWNGHRPPAFSDSYAINLQASGAALEKWTGSQTDIPALLRQSIQEDRLEVCGGPYLEREDALLPVESQLWNLVKGQETYKKVLGAEVRVFARKRTAAHPYLPLFLHAAGIQRALLLAFDDAVVPTHRSMVVSWPSPDGKQVEAFARKPFDGGNPQTYFHLAHYLNQTIMQDHAATLVLVHTQPTTPAWHHDWKELSRLAPVLGKWTTFTRYFTDVLAGEYTSAAQGDDFHCDYLLERTGFKLPNPVSDFARHIRWRRIMDTAWTLAAMERGLGPGAQVNGSEEPVEVRLTRVEDEVESVAGSAAGQVFTSDHLATVEAALAEVQRETAEDLAHRLLAKAKPGGPGFLVLNPCSFIRRVAIEVPGMHSPLPIEGPIKACQIAGDTGRLVIEVPALGFAWFPQAGPAGVSPQKPRMKLADERMVRNEFFEAEIDPATGGLRAIRDHHSRVNRVGQQLIFQPGSTMRARSIQTTSAGPALGEIVTEGDLLDPQEKVLATFRQRFRAWLGRPLLEMHIEIHPDHQPEGYPWHAYYGARFAWRDDRAHLIRGIQGFPSVTTHTRPMTPDYLELRSGRQSTSLFPGGLPFHQRHGSRMLDVILIPEGESATAFDLAIGLDRENPMQTALGLVTPVPFVATPHGPPHIGATGWLYHLDAPNLLLHNIRPAPDQADALLLRFLEIANHAGQAELRCVRDPSKAAFQDLRGQAQQDLVVQGDTVQFETLPGDLCFLRVDFS